MDENVKSYEEEIRHFPCGTNPLPTYWSPVEIDGETRWKGVVNSHHDELKFLISETDANLTLVTRDYNPRYWLYSGLSYGGGPPPAHPGVVLPKLWCSGSAWVILLACEF